MKFPVFSLIATVFLFWLTIQIDTDYEEYLSYFFILTVGIIHGSNDISLINLLTKASKPSLKYLAFYIGLVLFTVFAFASLPLIALIFFIVISCYHFGEQHFHRHIKNQNRKSKLLFFSYGLLIFGLLFYFNADSTSLIIYELVDVSITESQFMWFLIVDVVLTLVFFVLNKNNLKSGFDHFQELFLILLFTILFKLAALLWAFAIYFIIWHSIPSLLDQIRVLYGETNKISFIKYIKSSLLYWLISIFGLVLLYYFTTYFEIRFVTIFFAFLAAITIPHVIVMYFLNKN
jgi:Brp/Blh family beta-carotene 15,15'-monooxygenase